MVWPFTRKKKTGDPRFDELPPFWQGYMTQLSEDYEVTIAQLTADRAAQAERMARMQEALRRAACPRPCNGRPDDFEVGQCVDAGECGCCLGDPLMKPAKRAALSQEGSNA